MKKFFSFKNFSIDLLIKILNFSLQALFYFLILKIIPLNVYGAITSVTAIIAIFYVLSDISFSELIIKYGSRNKIYAKYFLLLSLNLHFYLGIFLLFLSSIILTFLFFQGDYKFFVPIFFLIATDLILFKVIYIYSRYLLSLEKIKESNIVNTIWLASKFVALMILYFLKHFFSLFDFYFLFLMWSFIYFSTEFFVLLYFFKSNFKKFKLINLKKSIKILNKYKNESLHFSIGIFSKSMYTNIDKVMLTKFLNFESVGIYGFLLKILNIFSFPAKSLIYIIYPKLFRLSIYNVTFFKLLYLIMLVMFINILFTLPFILLSKYIWNFFKLGEFNFPIIFAMFILVNIEILAIITSDILTGLNFQSYRSRIQFFTLIINIVLNIVLIPKYETLGAIYATILSELLLFIFAIYILRKKICM